MTMEANSRPPFGRESAQGSLGKTVVVVSENLVALVVMFWIAALTLVVAFTSLYVADWMREPAARLDAVAGDRQVTLNWRARGAGFADVVGWEYRQRVGAKAWGAWRAIPGGANAREHVVEGLINAWAYTFSVHAVRMSGKTSAGSNLAAATPSGIKERLTEIRNLLIDRDSVRDFCHDEPEDVGTVQFNGGSFDTRARSQRDALERIAKGLKRAPESRTLVIVEGHASADYDAAYNLDLSEDRAEAVVRELLSSRRGFQRERFDFRTVARGERHEREYPGRDDHENRRVRVWLCTPVAAVPAGG